MTGKRTAIISVALLAALAAAYPLYRRALRGTARAGEGQPLEPPPAGSLRESSSRDSGQLLFDGSMDGGLTAAGRAMTARDSGAGSAADAYAVPDPGETPGGVNGAEGGAAAAPGKITSMDTKAQDMAADRVGRTGTAAAGTRSGRASAGTARNVRSPARFAAGAAGPSPAGGQRGAAGAGGKNRSARLPGPSAIAQAVMDKLPSTGVTGGNDAGDRTGKAPAHLPPADLGKLEDGLKDLPNDFTREGEAMREETPPPTCANCHGVFVRGRYDPNRIGQFSCNGSVCRTCSGVTPANACTAFCLNGKENLWGSPKDGLPDVKTFTRAEMAEYSALFALFGYKIPEKCVCQRSMFGSASSYGMGYSDGSCRGCVPLPSPPSSEEEYHFSACRTADWCSSHCR